MAIMKKRVTRRKIVRRRRVARPRTRIPSKTHLFKRLGQTIVLDNNGVGGIPHLVSSGAGSAVLGATPPSTFLQSNDAGVSMEFRLNCVVDYTDLTRLFDRYKLVGVKLNILYQQNTANSNQTSTAIMPTLYSAFDFDDATPPSIAEDVTAKGYCKTRILNANLPYSIFLKPRMPQTVNVQGETGLQSVNATSVRPQWLDCGIDNVPHYGLKLWLTNLPDSAGPEPTCQLRIQPIYYLALKDTQ